VLLPACRAPFSVTTRVSLRASVTRLSALRGTSSRLWSTGPVWCGQGSGSGQIAA
jgi:hypothetical protein